MCDKAGLKVTNFCVLAGEFSDQTTVEITVLPQNQHKPKFVSPSLPNATVYVQEVSVVVCVSANGRQISWTLLSLIDGVSHCPYYFKPSTVQ